MTARAHDLQLPRPLLSPSQWPAGPSLLSIDSLRYGGPFARIAASGSVSFVVPEHFWLREAGENFAALLSELRLPEITLISRSTLDRGEFEAWQARVPVPVKFVVDRELKLPTLLEWSLEVFPESAVAAGEIHWTRLMKEYEQRLGGGLAGLDALRFWPSFLRSKKLFFADAVAREWAYAQALFSPQDDARGTGAHVIANPTMQVVTSKEALSAVWRIDGAVDRRDLTWEEAAVIDELRETPRLPLEVLRHELHGKAFPLKNHSSFNLVIEDMVARGLLLLRA